MYFNDRVQAGKQLAELLDKYRDEEAECAVVALSDGSVVVGAQIAAKLHCVITMLMTEAIKAPGEPEAVASINQDGGFTYNNAWSSGQLEDFDMEYHHYFEQKKLEKLSKMHRLLGRQDLIQPGLLRGRTVILVSDGLKSGYSLESAADYLKSIKIQKLLIATPLASIPAIDMMHLIADEIYCLDTVENYMNTDHYYEDNTLPSHETIIGTIQNVVENWNGAKR